MPFVHNRHQLTFFIKLFNVFVWPLCPLSLVVGARTAMKKCRWCVWLWRVFFFFIYKESGGGICSKQDVQRWPSVLICTCGCCCCYYYWCWQCAPRRLLWRMGHFKFTHSLLVVFYFFPLFYRNRLRWPILAILTFLHVTIRRRQSRNNIGVCIDVMLANDMIKSKWMDDAARQQNNASNKKSCRRSNMDILRMGNHIYDITRFACIADCFI